MKKGKALMNVQKDNFSTTNEIIDIKKEEGFFQNKNS